MSPQKANRGPKPRRVRIPVQQLPHAAGLPLPAYQTEAAAGLDLVAALPAERPVTVAPGGRVLIPTGLRLALPIGHEAQVRPRSGLALKHGVTVLNSPGTIDADYRGEVQVILVNHGQEPFEIRRGERIAQMVVLPVTQARLVRRVALDETARGSGGFGSTGRAPADEVPSRSKTNAMPKAGPGVVAKSMKGSTNRTPKRR